MKTKETQLEFKKLDQQQLDDNTGGVAGMLALAVSLTPLVTKLVNTGVNAYKTITSDSGSIKQDGVEMKWENHKPAAAPKQDTKVVYYAY